MTYNQRVQQSVNSISDQEQSLAIIGRGRNADEQSLVLVEKGNFLGFGYIDKTASVSSLSEARNFIKAGKENRIAQNIINSYLLNPRGGSLVIFDHP